jgi:type I restriction-modification system DNA methylase subunit
MTLELAGFRNVGEFYSPHYVEAVLEGDLKDVLRRWSEAERAGGPKSPPRRLLGLSNKYFGLVAKAAGAKPDERAALARELHVLLLDALGYDYAPDTETIDDEDGQPISIDVLGAIERDHKPWLFVIGAPFGGEEDDPFDYPVSGDRSARELFDGPLFRQVSPPRWVLYLAGAHVFLIDRHKWPQGKYLAFSLSELFARKVETAFEVLAALLHKTVLAPDDGTCLHDTLDEASHKHAYAVSTDLKKGAREAIELLANEAIHYIRTVQKKGVFENDTLADQLKRECLVYLYRLLFLFYVEARGGETGVAPMSSDAYRTGYSLDSLRDLELVKLTTKESQEGTFLHESLERLFFLVNRGYGKGQLRIESRLAEAAEGFVMDGLRSPLFDPDATPLLRSVKFRNRVLQRVIELLSLSEPKGKQQRGRISYAQLGINQLGAVYEGLLAYSGFFATEDLYEVQASAKGGEESDGEARVYFVPKKKLEELPKEAIVKKDGKPVVHPKGSFVFRLAGRDREKTASYYTPEVLTACLTKYTLKEHLGSMTADAILRLTVCEPAMGSGAFLNEAVNQLADAYLERKQAETGTLIPAADYALERQRVKDYIARHNVYGVDLNPLAKELGAISLWLNVLHPGARAPWFGARLAVGNSLFGARREVFAKEDLEGVTSWLDAVPEPVPPSGRARGRIYHFLVADRGMASYDDDKVVKATFPNEVARIKEWRKAQTKPWTALDLEALERISARIDTLFVQHAADRKQLLEKTRQPIALFGQPPPEDTRPRTVEECEEHARPLSLGTAAGRRLAAVMDYWCALWVWPIEHASLLPTRDEWLVEIERLLEADVDEVSAKSERLRLVRDLAARYRFFHWEVAFAEVFSGGRTGFDVVLGNPPWIKLEWNEAAVLADFDPAIAVRGMSSADAARQRARILDSEAARTAYFAELEEIGGIGAFLNAGQNYPLLQGVQINLYKCFQCLGWRIAPAGTVGLIYQPGLFDDAKGGALRASFYTRARLVARFKNELNLFSIDHQKQYCLTVSGSPQSSLSFVSIGNLFHPRTIDESLKHDGHGAIPGIKHEGGGWELRGHRARIVLVTDDLLEHLAQLFDAPGTPPREARLPILHSVEMLKISTHLAGLPKLGPPGVRWGTTGDWHEGNRTKDGTIVRRTAEPSAAKDLIVSGPQLYVATPFSKTPNLGCRNQNDYSIINLEDAPDSFLPRTTYVRGVNEAEYAARIPRFRDRAMTEFFRHAHRRRIDPTGERSLIGCILPRDVMALEGVFVMAFESLELMTTWSALTASLPLDFFVKTSGKTDARGDLVQRMPFNSSMYDRALRARALRLNCLTTHYAPLWEELFDASWTKDGFTKDDPRLPSWSALGPKWSRDSALRTAYARRQALVEIDALAALALGLTADELCLLYRVQFPVLQQYERETFYDQNGRIVFTTNKGLPGVGLERKQWEEVKDLRAGDPVPPFAARYVPPFDRCDREEDMRRAFSEFSRRIAKANAS